jgi:hypothetical protein
MTTTTITKTTPTISGVTRWFLMVPPYLPRESRGTKKDCQREENTGIEINQAAPLDIFSIIITCVYEPWTASLDDE